MRGSRTEWRSLWADREVEGEALAVVVASGVNGSTRWRRGSEQRRERESWERGERCKGSRGVRGTLGCLQRRAGKQEVAGALGRAPRLASAYWQRKTTSGEVGGLGWSSWAAAGLPGKSSALF